ncbi:SPOR domain-containing protein, partial [Alphaproteobacteria bacterium]|nr:SPOR domain-containing protein [Alphaproteobacteria bacterium]
EVGPDRVRPDPGTPSGQQIPHQNQQVFDVVTGDSGKSRQELLTDRGEQPMLVPGSTDGAQIAARPAPANGSPIQLLPPKPLPLNIDPPAVRQPAQEQAPPPVVRRPPLIVVPSNTDVPPQQQSAPPPQRPPLIVTPAPVVPAPAPVVAQPAPKPQRRQVASLPPSYSYRIQIAAVRSNAAAQREWQRLRRQNKDILGSLQLFVQQVNVRNKGVYHRIQAGPLPDRILAEIACSDLKSRGVGCLIVAQ